MSDPTYALQLLQKNEIDYPTFARKVADHLFKHEQVVANVQHQFEAGLYIRTMFVPADTFAVGQHQKFEHLNVVLQGACTVINEDGSMQTVTAPCTFVGKPGQKVGYFHEDTIWQNVYPAGDIKTVEEAEAHFWLPVEHQEALRKQWTEEQVPLKEGDRADYAAMLDEMGITDEVVQAEMSAVEVIDDFNHSYRVTQSAIQGLGVFLEASVEAGTVIGAALLNGKKTRLGRYINHSPNPTAQLVPSQDGNIYVVAAAHIAGRAAGFTTDEVTINYRCTPRGSELLKGK